jgi:hypothetical protein
MSDELSDQHHVAASGKRSRGPVFILGAHKSGTTLLRNLLDGHPGIHAVPMEVHYSYVQGLATLYPRRMALSGRGAERHKRITRMLEVMGTYHEHGDERADAHLQGRFNLLAAERHLLDRIGADAGADDLGHYVDGISVGLGLPLRHPEQIIVEKSVDHMEHAFWLRSLFPEARFIFVVRDPYANLASFRRFVAKGSRFPSLIQPLRTLEFAFHFASLYRDSLPGCRLVRYEDLVSDPEGIMSDLATFMGIPWHPLLLEPTTLGRSWAGNSSTGRSFKGVAPVGKGEERKDVRPVESLLIGRSSLSLRMAEFGYSPMPYMNAFLPERGESFKTYLRNRLYRIYADGA